jgi:hypothetical protein
MEEKGEEVRRGEKEQSDVSVARSGLHVQGFSFDLPASILFAPNIQFGHYRTSCKYSFTRDIGLENAVFEYLAL